MRLAGPRMRRRCSGRLTAVFFLGWRIFRDRSNFSGKRLPAPRFSLVVNERYRGLKRQSSRTWLSTRLRLALGEWMSLKRRFVLVGIHACGVAETLPGVIPISFRVCQCQDNYLQLVLLFWCHA